MPLLGTTFNRLDVMDDKQRPYNYVWLMSQFNMPSLISFIYIKVRHCSKLEHQKRESGLTFFVTFQRPSSVIITMK